MCSATCNRRASACPDRESAAWQDPDVSTDEKWPLFETLWRATEHTAYARVTKLVLKNVYGEDQDDPRRAGPGGRTSWPRRTRRPISAPSTRPASGSCWWTCWAGCPRGWAASWTARRPFPAKWRPLISLPGLHPTTLSGRRSSRWARWPTGTSPRWTSTWRPSTWSFQRCIERGAVGIKDQSAYERILSYDLVPTAEAERLFNRVLADPRNSLGWPEGKPLNDYLFHQYMRFARDLDLPVQLHTGHMAGIRNRVDKTNAAHLASVLELHRDVRFDLFHGNWPYLGDLLFLGKNYPNVALDCAGCTSSTPTMPSELLERAVLTLPHTKIHGFGGDYGDVPEFVAGAPEDRPREHRRRRWRAWSSAAGWTRRRPCRWRRTGCSTTPTASSGWGFKRSDGCLYRSLLTEPRKHNIIRYRCFLRR